jgi:hypothetical protein
MRTYRAGEGPLIMFSNEPTVEGDTGDGAGAPVFATLPLAAFGELNFWSIQSCETHFIMNR